MKFVWFFIIIGLLVVVSDAKRKRKFEGDFEFADEDEPRNTKAGEKKRWIHDPNNERCHSLNCKKKELCLLEDDFTAVCVSKKELHKNGDIVIPKAKLLAEEEEAKRRAAAALEDDDDDDMDEDDVFYDAEEEDVDDQEEDVNEECKPCPVVKPTFLCGADNHTYSSLCRLDYHNCIHHTTVRVNCKGFCPCKDTDIHLRKKQRQQERLTNFMNKYKATLDKNNNAGNKVSQQLQNDANTNNNNILDRDRYTFTPEDFKYENKHYKYIKYTKYNKESKLNNPTYAEDKERQRGYNDVIDNKMREKPIETRIPATTVCPPSSLHAMGNRLLDWFSVVMADTSRRRRVHPKPKVTPTNLYPAACKREVRWMFQHLDTDGDGKLSLQELFDLEHDKNEQCIKPFVEQCDNDHNNWVTPREWCRCFDKADRSCAAVKSRISTDSSSGVYVPDCDINGYYKPTQCHSIIGMCWCVDKHGVEYANTRTRGKPNCESLIEKSTSLSSKTQEENNDDEDGNDDVEQDIEGSADQPLDF
ncbi:proteoglycan Cow [Chrysoperla carnea]|uniref:proteoglycan Cow n=1 Tax=Chrysoperla carnea TaxID=189513 RepID=UPI001D09278F|nr:proteoglycan Cow [Chrysoperla carnea]